MIKKLTPDYFGWVLLFIIHSGIALFWLWVINKGLTLEKRYFYDFEGYSLALLALILFGFEIYGLWLLIQFLKIEMGRKIVFDGENETLIIQKKGVSEALPLIELEELILSERLVWVRNSTAHLSYSQLNFKSKDPILVTSFVLNTKEMDELIGNRANRVVTTNRKHFEGIKIK